MRRSYGSLPVAMMVAVMLSACGMGGHGTGGVGLPKGVESIGLINSYTMIRQDFENGRIMRARSRALAMPQDHRDYDRVQAYLRQTIEPARRRVFTHYLQMARKLEAEGSWSEAMWAYDQATAVTVKPELMEAQRDAMELKMRQLRLNRLIEHRRELDKALLNDARYYRPPHGLAMDDEPYSRLHEQYEDRLDERASLAIREARRYLHKGLPEIAYVEIESYLRLQPDASGGKQLREEILAAMPAGLVIPAPGNHEARVSAGGGRPASDQPVTEEEIQAALKAGALLRAKELAHAFRRNGGANASQLVAQIDKRIEAKAAALFTSGSNEFRQEHLDRAIAFWREAVELNPDVAEYVESLRRARQLQDRLRLLRDQPGTVAREPDGLESEISGGESAPGRK
ncbi:4-hydroxy-3-methylbut-2-en-1-yl diphosphate synthase [Mariprofundus erugo]|uniref:4-hydroxy-3-methylbut-2-en-1-yl diphosphate synthase n=1 Tax=Mariprofundus erugo TaxID=2528639 RepID=UPI00159C02C7|nr:4-hydroxy-3-methylbut-2-en-1-yl diphosphate synthase [Mariprofundus erugo]